MSLSMGDTNGTEQSCTWIVSGAAPRVSVTSLQTAWMYGAVSFEVEECEAAACTSFKLVSSVDLHEPGVAYQSAAPHLRRTLNLNP